MVCPLTVCLGAATVTEELAVVEDNVVVGRGAAGTIFLAENFIIRRKQICKFWKKQKLTAILKRVVLGKILTLNQSSDVTQVDNRPLELSTNAQQNKTTARQKALTLRLLW